MGETQGFSIFDFGLIPRIDRVAGTTFEIRGQLPAIKIVCSEKSNFDKKLSNKFLIAKEVY